jgi:hypothetical protein
MKDLGQNKFCLGLQIDHCKGGIILRKTTYIGKILKQLYMDKSYPLSTTMVVRSPDVMKDPFRFLENGSDTLGPQVSYLSAVGVLMYLSTHI